MIKRRTILSGISTITLGVAGCLQSPRESTSNNSTSEQCADVTIARASVEIEYWCDTGPGAKGSVIGLVKDCTDELTLEIRNEDRIINTYAIDPDPYGNWQVEIITDSVPDNLQEATVMVRGPDGEDYAERSLSTRSYLDSPNLSVVDGNIEPETVTVGDPVTVTFGVSTFGGGTDFTASLLVEDEPVETREGTVEGGADCGGFSGPEYEFTHMFDDPGEYELAGKITVEESPGAGDSELIGTVTVTE